MTEVKIFASKYATFQQKFSKKGNFEKQIHRKLTTFTLLSLFSTSANDEKQMLCSEDDDSGIQTADSKSGSISPILSEGIINGIDMHKIDTGSKSDWKSILVTSFLCFCVIVQSSLYLASMWPFLKTLDSTATERFYGYIIAAQSLGEMLGCPIVGYLSNRSGQIRYLLYICTSLMFAGNVMYFSLELSTPVLRKYLLLVARFLVGLGCSSTCLLQAYVSTASIPEDRSRALSILTTGIALAGVFGPALQLLFTPLGYSGWNIFAWKINMYTAPAFIGSIINVISIMSIYVFFQENYAGIIQEQKTFMLSYSPQALPEYDRLAAFLCHFTRFTKFFIISCLESIGISFAAMMFSWSNAEVIVNMASAESIMNILSLLTYFSYIILRLDKIMNFRLNCIICLFSYFTFYLATYSFPFLPNRIMTYNETAVNQTDEIGCNSGSFSWCGSINSVNPTLFFTCYILLFGVGFASMNVALNTVFSKIIGPRRQGTHQGFLQMSGGIARMIGPVIITSLYTSYGPRMVWDLELSVILVTILLWIILYKRMVPLKLKPQLLMVRSKQANKSDSSFNSDLIMSIDE
ncbi:major facilitator superfamily domain-containing protein [Ditylenchus destructor]|uniref:Major facilitator superfamily domain-containing protein n=1 Tax=Ditylenchus destructor TaxID=166010 RepID=A0AAD4QX05_9BILA|nr:major facilitator superfamily domain-containing protein [Ditylenchus destructor]